MSLPFHSDLIRPLASSIPGAAAFARSFRASAPVCVDSALDPGSVNILSAPPPLRFATSCRLHVLRVKYHLL
jgi:hypothetical protein